MPTRFRALLLTGLCILALPGAGLRPAAARPRAAAVVPEPTDAYIHVSTARNTIANVTLFENPALNDNPDARFLVTSQLQPGGGIGDRALGFPSLTYGYIQPGRWGLFDVHLASMPLDLSWNVFIPPQDQVIVHTTTTTSTSMVPSRSYLSSPLFNGDPNAVLFVQRMASIIGGVFNDPLAVTYDSGRGLWAIADALGNPMPANLIFFVWRAGPGGPNAVFRHTSTSANDFVHDGTLLDNPAANGQPDALLLVTPTASGSQPIDTHPLGVWYDPLYGRWTIFNQDGITMTSGLSWNVAVIPPLSAFFLQTVIFDNTFFPQITVLDDPRLNNNPEARLYVSHNWNPPESPNGLYDDHPIGVRYNHGFGRWYICNLDGHDLPLGATFNVYFTWPRGSSFKVAASSTNTISAQTLLVNSPLLNGNADAAPIVTDDTPSLGLCGFSSYANPVGVVPSFIGWQILNSGNPFPPGLSFDVLVPPAASSFQHYAVAGNTFGDSTVLDNPLTNGDPWAMVFATPREAFSLNEHNLGVYYAAGKWSIFNEDKSSMLTGTGYDVFVIKRRYEYLPILRR